MIRAWVIQSPDLFWALGTPDPFFAIGSIRRCYLEDNDPESGLRAGRSGTS